MKSVFRRFPHSRMNPGSFVEMNYGWTADKVADDFFEAVGGVVHDAEVVMASVSSMDASGGRVMDSSIIFPGQGDAPFSGNAYREGSATLDGAGSMEPGASKRAAAAVFSDGESSLVSDPYRLQEAGFISSGASTLDADSLREAIAAMEALAEAVLESLPERIAAGLSQAYGSSGMVAEGWKNAVAASLFFGSGELSAEAEEVFFMAQINPAAFQIVRFTGMNPSNWTVVSVPPGLPVCRRVVIRNMSANTIQVCTDPENSDAIDTIAGNATYTIPLTFGMFSGYGFGNSSYGSDVCLIKGSGPEQPLIAFLS